MYNTDKEVDLFEIIQCFTDPATKNWRKLPNCAENFEIGMRRKYLWVWPTASELGDFQKLLQQISINTLLSIGCGNGLLEWILQESLDIKVHGLEVDRNWWESRYAVPSFIPLNFIDDYQATYNTDLLQKCCQTNDWKFALLFCYFNNFTAFLQYLQIYQGDWIIIIGPKCGTTAVHTDPMPYTLNEHPQLHFHVYAELSLGTDDVIVIYKRNN